MLKLKTSPILALICLCFIAQLTHATTLELISSVPANNAVDVSRTDILTLQFSTTINAKSVNAATVTLQSAAGFQQVSLKVSGAVISIRPVTPLLPWTAYTLNVNSVMGSGGEQLATWIALAFNTRDATWQPPQLIDRLTPTQWSPMTATNISGIRFVAWLQSSGSSDDIWAIRLVPGESPSAAVLVASFPQDSSTLDISELNVVVDDDGNAFVTWVADKSPPLPRHIWANRFVAGSSRGSGWGTPQIIDGYAKRSGTNLHLVFDHAGNALALWQEYDCCGIHSLQSIVANRYTRNSGWSKPIHLDDSGSLLAGKIDLKMDDAGNAFATWVNFPSYFNPTSTLQLSRYVSNVGWSVPLTVATETTTSSTGNQALAVNPNGQAFLMWADDTGLKFILANTADSHISTISLIDSNVTISPSQMAFINSGQAFAAFVNGVKNFLPNQYQWSWTHPLLTDQNASSDPLIVADANGNALVAWTQKVNGVNRIYAKRYRASRGWFGSMPIDSGSTLGAELQELFVQPDGSIVAAWLQNNEDGTMDVETARFE